MQLLPAEREESEAPRHPGREEAQAHPKRMDRKDQEQFANRRFHTRTNQGISICGFVLIKSIQNEGHDEKTYDPINGKLSELGCRTGSQNLIGCSTPQRGSHSTGSTLNHDEKNNDYAK